MDAWEDLYRVSSVSTAKIPSHVSYRIPPTTADMSIVKVFRRSGNRGAEGSRGRIKWDNLLVYERMKKKVATTQEEKEEKRK